MREGELGFIEFNQQKGYKMFTELQSPWKYQEHLGGWGQAKKLKFFFFFFLKGTSQPEKLKLY